VTHLPTMCSHLTPKEQMTNGFYIPHITQVLLLKCTPLLCKLSYVATLLKITGHAKNWVVGKALTFQKRPNTTLSCLISPFRIIMLTSHYTFVYLLPSKTTHPPSLHGLFLCILCIKVVTPDFSHSNHYLLHKRFHIH